MKGKLSSVPTVFPPRCSSASRRTRASENVGRTSCRLGSWSKNYFASRRMRRPFMGHSRAQPNASGVIGLFSQLNIDYRFRLRRSSNAAGCHLSTITELIAIIGRLLDRFFLRHHRKGPTRISSLMLRAYSPSIRIFANGANAGRDFRITIERIYRICTRLNHSSRRRRF